MVKRLLSMILAILLAVTMMPESLLERMEMETEVQAAVTLSNPRIVEDSSMEAGQKVTWDCVWFGSYPQREVVASASQSGCYGRSWSSPDDYIVDSSLYNTLSNATGWDSNGDKILGNAKYRRIKKSDATYATSGDSDYYNWSDSTSYHYFKHEPIKWRVLKVNGSSAFLLADKALDDQGYNRYNVVVTWEISGIRSWLNGYGASVNQAGTDYSTKNFLKCAFSSSEQNAILTTNVVNNSNIEYSIKGGNNTSDKIFLLSEEEVYTDAAKGYGFVSSRSTGDEGRRSKSSTYAKAMGTYSSAGTSYKGNCYWWLRSPGNLSSLAVTVRPYGYVYNYGNDVLGVKNFGCRPALNLNLQSSSLYSYAGTVCSDGTVNESGKSDTEIILDESMEASTNEEITISADLKSTTMTPTSSNMSWLVEDSEGNSLAASDVSIGNMSILTTEKGKYILSSNFTFKKPGDYTVWLESDDGAFAKIDVSVGKLNIRILSPSKGHSYASDINQQKTFTVTMNNVEEDITKEDLDFEITRSKDMIYKDPESTSSAKIEIKDINKIALGKYEFTFSCKADEVGLYGISVNYKGTKANTDLMVYDTAVLDELEKDLDGTVKKYYKEYVKKVKKEVKAIYEENSDEEPDYASLGEELAKDSANIMVGTDIADANADVESIRKCAFEAYARYIAEMTTGSGVGFDEVDNQTANKMITQKIIKYINSNISQNDTDTRLQSMATIAGKKYKVDATWLISYGTGHISLKIKDTKGTKYTYSVSNGKTINAAVANYLDDLKKLEISACVNISKAWYKDFVDLTAWDIKKEFDDAMESKLKSMSENIFTYLEKHGIINLYTNIMTCREYYKQVKDIKNKLKSATEVLSSSTTSISEKYGSLKEIKDLKINEVSCGVTSADVYDKLKAAESKSKEYLEEYFKTGTIKDLENENLFETLKNGVKSIVKCPVSVSVINGSGQVVGFISEDDFWYTDNNIYLDEDGDAKIVYTPKFSDYRIVITGDDYGQVSYSAEDIVDGQLSGHRVNCYDIPVEAGTVINVNLPQDKIDSASDVHISCSETACNPVMISDSSSHVSISISNNDAEGTVSGQGQYVLGDVVTVVAQPKENYLFCGWYSGNQLESFSSIYQFQARSSKTLKAVYQKKLTESEIKALNESILGPEEHTHTWDAGKVTKAATYTATGIKTYTCTICNQTKKETIPMLKKPAQNHVIIAKDVVKTYSPKTQSFDLKAKSGYGGKMTYSSNHKDVRVSSNGRITVKAKFMGAAVITIKVAMTSSHNAASKKITVTVLPSKTSLKSLRNSGSRKMKVTWKKNSIVSGYELQYAKDGNFTKGVKTKTIKGYKKVSKTLSSLSRGKKYYVRIRTYKTISGKKYYSAWSSVKKLKIK